MSKSIADIFLFQRHVSHIFLSEKLLLPFFNGSSLAIHPAKRKSLVPKEIESNGRIVFPSNVPNCVQQILN